MESERESGNSKSSESEKCPFGDEQKEELLRMEENMEGWRCVNSDNNCRVYLRQNEEEEGKETSEDGVVGADVEGREPDAAGVQAFKTFIKLPGIPYFQALEYAANIEIRKEWDPIFHQTELLEERGHAGKILYGCVEMPGEMVDRDFVYVLKDFVEEETGKTVIFWQSCDEYPDIHGRANSKRGIMHLCGLIVRPSDDFNSTLITGIGQMDFKGNSNEMPEIKKLFMSMPMAWRTLLIKHHETTLSELKKFYSDSPQPK